MGKWIRSQNKKVLVYATDLLVSPNEPETKWFVVSYKGEEETYLGTYSTEAKALEVLNDIHFEIEHTEESTVYRMPED